MAGAGCATADNAVSMQPDSAGNSRPIRAEPARAQRQLAALGVAASAAAMICAALAGVYPGRGLLAGLAAAAALIALVAVLAALRRPAWAAAAPSPPPFADDFAAVTLQSVVDGVIATDARGRVHYLNRSAESLTGWPLDEAVGRPLGEIFRVMRGSDRSLVEEPAAETLRSGQPSQFEGSAVLLVRDGKPLPIDASVTALRVGEGQSDGLNRSSQEGPVLGAVVTFRDVEKERELSSKLAYQARHDVLTGLYNRNEFEYRLNLLFQSARSLRREHALLYIDLDQFKVVNDSCGHLAGDALLKQLTALLQREVRNRDTLARLGGDEFGVLLEQCSVEDATRIADQLLHTIQNFRFSWKDKTFNVGASIGLVRIDAQSEGVPHLMAAADSACYAAKDAGRNRIRAYSDDDVQLSLRDSELQWVSRLTRAMEEGRLRLYCQRIQPLAAGGDSGQHYEVLLRLEEGGELISAQAFLPAAERYNMVARIDRWVISHTLDWLQSSPAHLQQLALCSINLSGQSVGDRQFLDYAVEQLRSHAVPTEKLCFEITETAVIANMGHAIDFMTRLRELGCRFALDDFGSGLSSFGYLKDLPVDILKIDGSFVRDMLDDPINAAIVRSINDIGQVMGKRVVAEYVSRAELADELRGLGVDYAQGNWLHRPQALSELLPAAAADSERA